MFGLMHRGAKIERIQTTAVGGETAIVQMDVRVTTEGERERTERNGKSIGMCVYIAIEWLSE